MLAHHTTTPQRGKHFSRTVEVRQFDVGRAHALGVVRVGTNTGCNITALREFDRFAIVPLVAYLGIEDFDDIQLAHTGQRLQYAQVESGSLGVERVRRVDETSLRPDALHDIGYREHVRDAFRQEQSDELAGRRPDLFADDDPSTDIAHEYLRQGGELDAVMISNAHDIEMLRLDAVDELVKCRARIPRRRGVQVTIEAHPTDRRRGRRPNRHQHEEGD